MKSIIHCIKCGKTEDFTSPIIKMVMELIKTRSDGDKIIENSAKSLGGTVKNGDIHIKGVCPECGKAGRNSDQRLN